MKKLGLKVSSLLLATSSLAATVVLHGGAQPNKVQPQPPAARQIAAGSSAEAFEAIVPVLHHPRCMNCHMSGEFPRQGDDSHRHFMQVGRGADGHGVAPVRCSTCHQDHNLPGIHMPPGAADWALPPRAHPMVWEGLSDRQLCLLFKDPQQNGHRTVEQLIDHMHTPLVLWGWHPGDGRTPIPMPEEQFQAYVRAWVHGGAACPAQ